MRARRGGSPCYARAMSASDASSPLFLLPPLMLAVIIFVACALGAAVAWAVPHVLLRLPTARAPHPPFHAAMVALFALFLSFTAADAWRRGDAAYLALLREASEVGALHATLGALAEQGAPGAPMIAGLRDYLDASLKQEWRHANTVSSPEAAAALDGLWAATARELARGGDKTAAWRTVHEHLEGLKQARSARLVAGGLFGDVAKWSCLMVLFLVGATAISLVHLDRPKGAVTALVLFTLAGSCALTLVAVSEHPYTGWDAVTPDRLIALRATLG